MLIPIYMTFPGAIELFDFEQDYYEKAYMLVPETCMHSAKKDGMGRSPKQLSCSCLRNAVHSEQEH